MKVDTTIEPPTLDDDEDDGDGEALFLSFTVAAPGAIHNTSGSLPIVATLAQLNDGLIACLRGVAASWSPGLYALVAASLVDGPDTDARAWVSITDTEPHGSEPLTLAHVEAIDRHHRVHTGRPLQALRIGVDGEIVPLSAVRAVLKAAGQ